MANYNSCVIATLCLGFVLAGCQNNRRTTAIKKKPVSNEAGEVILKTTTPGVDPANPKFTGPITSNNLVAKQKELGEFIIAAGPMKTDSLFLNCLEARVEQVGNNNVSWSNQGARNGKWHRVHCNKDPDFDVAVGNFVKIAGFDMDGYDAKSCFKYTFRVVSFAPLNKDACIAEIRTKRQQGGRINIQKVPVGSSSGSGSQNACVYPSGEQALDNPSQATNYAEWRGYNQSAITYYNQVREAGGNFRSVIFKYEDCNDTLRQYCDVTSAGESSAFTDYDDYVYQLASKEVQVDVDGVSVFTCGR